MWQRQWKQYHSSVCFDGGADALPLDWIDEPGAPLVVEPSVVSVTFRLADFSSLLEVFVALHLAFSLVRDVSHAAARRFELHSEHLKRYFPDLDEAAQNILRPMIAELDIEVFKLDRRLEPLVRWMSLASVLVAVYGIGLLVYSGLFPDSRFSVGGFLAVLVPAVLPFPMFLTASYVWGLGESIRAGEKSFAALSEFNRLVRAGRLVGRGR